jgi:uncharacterized protein involved in exopolysaccharide biosynthesis
MTSTTSPPRPREREGDAAASLVGIALRPLPSVRALALMGAMVLAVSAGAALAFGLLTQRLYGAQAEIIFQPSGELSVFRAERDMATQELILRGRAVLEPVARMTGIPLEDLQDMVLVEILGQSNVLRITVANPDPETARALAELVTTEYLTNYSASSAIEVDPAADRLERQVQTLSNTLSKMLDRLEQLTRQRGARDPTTAEEQQLRRTITSTLQRMGSLQDQLTTLEQKRFQQPEVTLLVPAHRLEGLLRPRPVHALAVGALVGLFLVAAIALTLLRPWVSHVGSGWR